LTGNIKYTLIALGLTWTLAAVGAELVWRGYLMNRVVDLGKHTRFEWICSLFVVNAEFGLAHSDQGVTGMIEEGIPGLFLGAIVLKIGAFIRPSRRGVTLPLFAALL